MKFTGKELVIAAYRLLRSSDVPAVVKQILQGMISQIKYERDRYERERAKRNHVYHQYIMIEAQQVAVNGSIENCETTLSWNS